MAYLLEQEGNYEAAHEVVVVSRRLFKEQNLFPEPPDEKPLIMVEEKVKEVLDEVTLKKITIVSKKETVSTLVEKYL